MKGRQDVVSQLTERVEKLGRELAESRIRAEGMEFWIEKGNQLII